MALNFKKITDELFTQITSDDLAAALGLKGQTIRKARMETDSVAKRSPPAGWEAAARILAERQAAHFTKLAAKLRAK